MLLVLLLPLSCKLVRVVPMVAVVPMVEAHLALPVTAAPLL
jgi:hypothetical protein